MTRRTRAALAAGIIAMTATLGAALPAAATPASVSAGELEHELAPVDAGSADSAAPGECRAWSWEALMLTARTTLMAHALTHYELTGLTGRPKDGASAGLQCFLDWDLSFRNPRNPSDRPLTMNLELFTATPATITWTGPTTALPATSMNGFEAFDRLRAAGYPGDVESIRLAPDTTGAAQFTLSLDRATQITVDADTGLVRNEAVPDLPRNTVTSTVGIFAASKVSTVGAVTCPAGHPYLLNADLGWGARGATVAGGGAHRATVKLYLYEYRGADGYVTGWDEAPNGISNKADGEVAVYALCTSDKKQAMRDSDVAVG